MADKKPLSRDSVLTEGFNQRASPQSADEELFVQVTLDDEPSSKTLTQSFSEANESPIPNTESKVAEIEKIKQRLEMLEQQQKLKHSPDRDR